MLKCSILKFNKKVEEKEIAKIQWGEAGAHGKYRPVRNPF